MLRFTRQLQRNIKLSQLQRVRFYSDSKDKKKGIKSEDKEDELDSSEQSLENKEDEKIVPKDNSAVESESPEESSSNDKPERKDNEKEDEIVVKKKPSERKRNNPKILAKLNLKNPKDNVPEKVSKLLAIPLTRRPLFPGFYKSLYIKDPKVILAIQELVNNGQPYIGIFLAKDENSEKDVADSLNDVEKIGVFCQITNTYQTGPDNSSLTVVVYPHRRIRITDISVGKEAENTEESSPVKIDPSNSILDRLNKLSLPVATVENLINQPYNSENRLIKATTSEIINVMKEISQSNPLLRDQIITVSVQTGNLLLDPSKLADFAAAISSGEPSELQAVLESLVVEERLHKALVILKKELANAHLQQEISKEVDRKINRKNQEYFLMEQLKGIKKELGLESDGKEKMIQIFKEKAAKLKMPEQVKKVFDEEMSKLQGLEPQASEFNVTRNYLDWLTQIPWGQHSNENFDVKTAEVVLDEDHYGLKDVKDRILEFIAVGNLRGSVEGKIITLVGPPGVVGGLTDVAEIKGHRRTYVGAMPGKVIQALKKVKTENPLIMIDEIDKLGRGHQGDPASALLELLDPEQNNSFLDHYMDVPIDLSHVLFVCTANSLETIPGPLLDRMEVISLSGYVAEEKVAIASKYLSPQSVEASGLKDYKVTLQEDTIMALIRNYCRENGVRNLKKHIDKIYRKAAFKIVNEKLSKDDVLNITPENLKDYVGSPIYTSDRMYATTPPGVIMGLAWTQMGGSSLFIESVLESTLKDDGKPSFHRTGQMGDVMKESSTIAYTYAKAFMAKRFPENRFFDHANIHMHVPEGATPKDGPSAGSTMTTSLLSLALDTPAIPDVAMTGEITLTGKILKIGGVKEKSIAAKRSGVKTIIFPAQNKSDWDELPDYLKENLTPHFVEWYDEIFAIVFPNK
ncbi:ATP-dependent Lon protease pim1 [Boothiomyces sp. JEL0838]|nr:ATP-dependent Lon protease pim1 [Boothiomyces sp. JEL0838]